MDYKNINILHLKGRYVSIEAIQVLVNTTSLLARLSTQIKTA